MTAATSTTSAEVLCSGDLALLQLALPFTLPDWLRLWLERSQLLGRGFELPTASVALEKSAREPGRGLRPRQGPVTRWVRVFGRLRLLDEARLFSPARELVHHGWFPVAGCGRRGEEIYFVSVRHVPNVKPGQLYVWSPTHQDLQPLDITLDELASCTPQDHAALRLRMPGGVRRARRNTPTLTPKTSSVRSHLRRPSAAARTLPLFPS